MQLEAAECLPLAPLLLAKLPLISKVLHSQNEKLMVGKFNPSRQRFETGFRFFNLEIKILPLDFSTVQVSLR